MKIYEIIFSPTGGTKRVSGVLAQSFLEIYDEDICRVDLAEKNADFSEIELSAEDVAIVAVPSFGGRVPAVAAERLSAIKGNGAKAVAVCVYGNRHYDDTFAEMQDILTAAGFVCAAGVAAIAEHSIMHGFATGRPDANDVQVLRDYAEKIADKFKGEVSALELPGNRPYKEYGGLPLKAQADDSCGSCGICVPACPVGAIPAEEPSTTDTEKCITCMACVAACPNGSRSVNADIVAAFTAKLAPFCTEPKENQLFI